MLVGCPKCRTLYRIDDSRVAGAGVILRCSRCFTPFRLPVKTTNPAPAAPDEVPASGVRSIRVLVANESPDFCRAVERVLVSEPFTVLASHDGHETLAMIDEHRPDVVLLDVALPGIYGFEICERIRNNPDLASVKTVLIASIYDKTRYKREPQALYGADDYIEKHHIPDFLAAKIYRLVLGQKTVDEAPDGTGEAEEDVRADAREFTPVEMEDQEAARDEIRKDEERKTSAADSPETMEAHRKARRLARIIVTDIALYNQKKVEQGILSGTFYELFEDDIREGRRLFEQRVPEMVRTGTSYLEDAFEEFLAQKAVELARNEERTSLDGSAA